MKRILILAFLVLVSCGRHSSGDTSLTDTATELQDTSLNPAPLIQIPVPAGSSDPLILLSEDIKPEIEFLKTGSILPSDGGMRILFKSIGYAKAQVRVRKVYPGNILQFLQSEDHGNWNLPKVSGEVTDTLLKLNDPRQEEIYSLNVSRLINADRGAIYHIEIRGREAVAEEDFWDSDFYFGDSDTYLKRSVDLLLSDLGLIVKKEDSGIRVWACNLLSSSPLQGAQVKLYDFAQQPIVSGFTDTDGSVFFQACSEAYFVYASWRGNKSYLPIGNASSLSTSNFDVSGTANEKGIKVFIFGERGVWRPGDTIHVSAFTLFGEKPLPAGHPIVAELLNPDGQVVQTINSKLDGGHICHFTFSTSENAVTGRWSVRITLGGNEYNKGIRIETIKPNNLDIDMDFGGGQFIPLKGDDAEISVNWLYGAPGSELKVNAEAVLRKAITRFRQFPGYTFDDSAVACEEQTMPFPEMKTDRQGRCKLPLSFELGNNGLPGLLNVEFSVRAFEPSGEFSTGVFTTCLSPCDRYVGIRTYMDKTPWGNEILKAGKPHRFDVVTADCNGKAVDGGELTAEVFHVSWSWWWNASSEIASYMSGNAKELVFTEELKTKGGKASFQYDWADAPGGLYYVRVRDPEGGHSASLLCEVSDIADAGRGVSEAATRLGIRTGKEAYTVGETAYLTIPSSAGSHVLVSIEKGGMVLDSFWVNGEEKSTGISIPVTAEMAPNVYAFVTLIQPHGNTRNDAPIRLYGVANLDVTDKTTKLEPVLDIPSKTYPEKKLRFRVKENSGRPMQYVVAVVDEGLLSLTGYKTPDPWKAFYVKEALRVRTWDQYDNVIGAYGGKIDRLFAIGGDDAATGVLKQKTGNRFTPVVSYLGPYDLPAGQTADHSIDVPQYVGSLRAMVIATDGRAQGSCAKNVTVSKPLMVKATLPRSVCSQERISVPVSVMALEKGVGKVRVELKAEGALKLAGSAVAETVLDKPGQEIVYFELEAAQAAGAGTVTVTARSTSDKSVCRVNLDVQLPGVAVARKQSLIVEAGEETAREVELFGIGGSSGITVEGSSIPSIDLRRRLSELTSYPYGCVEQTVSGAFPQLYLTTLSDCDEGQRAKMAGHVEAVIRKLQTYRTPEGGLSYWPGTGSTNAFCTAYALHFLNEASRAGYAVPEDLRTSLISYLKENVAGSNDKGIAFSRAYSLYALVGAGEPQRGQMNKMREKAGGYEPSCLWMLAAAFAADGKVNAAAQLVEGLSCSDKSYLWHGSEDRNVALAIKVLSAIGRKEEAMKLAMILAGRMNDSTYWMSTQATAWCLCSIGELSRGISGDAIDLTLETGGRSFEMKSSKAFASYEPVTGAEPGKASLKIRNNGKAPVYVCISSTGVLESGSEKEVSSGLNMTVRYLNDKGSALDISSLERGTAFDVVVKVTNTGHTELNNLALSLPIPSGWEVVNRRVWSADGTAPAGLDWQDFRDNRVDSFFSLKSGAGRTLKFRFIATYPGSYFLPACKCEAMYDGSVTAVIPGKRIEVK